MFNSELSSCYFRKEGQQPLILAPRTTSLLLWLPPSVASFRRGNSHQERCLLQDDIISEERCLLQTSLFLYIHTHTHLSSTGRYNFKYKAAFDGWASTTGMLNNPKECVAVFVLQCVAVSVLQCVCCSVLQCVCCSVLQCVCCSVLQCAAAATRCSTIKCATLVVLSMLWGDYGS